MGEFYTTEYMTPWAHEKMITRIFGGEEQPLLEADTVEKQLGTGGYPRLVKRTGETNVKHVETRRRRVLSEMGYMFHVLIGMRPCKIVCLFFLSYILAYLILGAILWALHDVTAFHGIDNYWEAVTFIGYTMATVGFGNQYPKAPQSSILPLMAVVFALLLDSFWLGVIMARIGSPRPLRHTLLFSKYAVLYDAGHSSFTLACRLVNLRLKYPWVDTRISMSLAVYDSSEDHCPPRMYDLPICDSAELFMDLPWEICHQVTNDSPFLRFVTDHHTTIGTMGGSKFNQERGEVIVEVWGTDPLTGNCVNKRFSYCADEILWDHGFEGILRDCTRDGGTGYEVDLTKFHNVLPRSPGQIVGQAAEQVAVSGAGYGTASGTA